MDTVKLQRYWIVSCLLFLGMLPFPLFGQLGVTAFPKISFVDPYWAGNRTDPNYYYDTVQDLGINLVVTNGETTNLDEMKQNDLLVWNADLGTAGTYAGGQNAVYHVFPVAPDGWFPNPGGHGSIEGEAFHANPAIHSPGLLLQTTRLRDWKYYGPNFYYFLQMKITNPDNLPANTPVATVRVYEQPRPTRQSPLSPDEQPELNGGLLQPHESTSAPPPQSYAWTLTIADFTTLGTEVIWQSPAEANLDKAYANYFELEWYGDVNLWIYSVEVKDVYNLRITSDPNWQGDIENDLADIYHRNPAVHFQWYRDEPDPLIYQAYGAVDQISAGSPNTGHLRLNGATGGRQASVVQQFVNQMHPPQLVYNYYPLLNDYSHHTDATPEPDATHNLQSAWEDRYINKLAQMIPIAQGAGIPFWMTIQVQHEQWVSSDCATWEYRYRDPSPQEIRAQVFLALAYGAKGIMYFEYPTGWFGEKVIYRGLVDVENGSDFTIDRIENSEGDICRDVTVPADYDKTGNYVPNEKWYAVQEVNQQLDRLAPIVLSPTLRWVNGYTLVDVGDVASEPGIVQSLLAATFPHTYIEVTNFEDTGAGDQYFWVVNRRCLPTETQTVTLRLTASSHPRLIEDVLAPK